MGLAAVLLVLILSAPQLLWFGYHWTLTIDAGRYLLDGWHLVSGQGYTLLNGTPETKRGPVFPGLLGVLMLFFGRDTESLAWAVRLVALVNPLLAYLLVKRISGPVAGLLAAVLVALFGYTARNPEAFNIDAALLTVYLVTLLVLLAAVRNNSSSLGFVSGLLLGVSLLTKETALANLPSPSSPSCCSIGVCARRSGTTSDWRSCACPGGLGCGPSAGRYTWWDACRPRCTSR